MPLRTLTSTLGLLCALFAFGCKPDCRLMCEKIEEADCFGSGTSVDCDEFCRHQEDLVANAGCQADYDALLVCLDGLENVCEAALEPCTDLDGDCDDPECDDEQDDLDDCFQDYCEDHPRNNECELGF